MSGMSKRSRSTNPRNGFDPETRIYHSLRPDIPLPPPHQPLSISQFTLSLLRETCSDADGATFIIDADTDQSLTYTEFVNRVNNLALHLKKRYSISPNNAAFILLPPSIHVPVVYYALLSLGVVLSPANPIGSKSEVAHQIQVSKSVIAFATSETVGKITSTFPLGTVLIDSPEFLSSLTQPSNDGNRLERVEVSQSDTAAILFSSGTTGRIKGVSLSHSNLIALIAGYHLVKSPTEPDQPEHTVSLFPIPLFHVFGFFMLLRTISLGDTMVLMKRFDFESMLKAVEKYKITSMPVSPPLIVALAKSDLTKKYDLSSLLVLGCGGAPLGKEVAMRFKQKFPDVVIAQGYGMTETGGGASRTIGPEETDMYASVGRLAENMQAKIVDPATGDSLPPGKQGELWLLGPTITKGYVGDDKATAETFDSEGWLKTGDLCYFDSEGFLYIVDRLKELIKYKGYQVPPAELEHILQSNPEIADVAVVPYPDEDAGEIPMAYVVRKPGGNITEAQVLEFVAKQVAPYKKIRRVAFINAIPKSAAGKILRRELANLAVSGGTAKL